MVVHGLEMRQLQEVESGYKEKLLYNDDSQTLGQVAQGDWPCTTLGGFQC